MKTDADQAEAVPGNAWRDGPFLVLPKKGTQLPDRCIVCNGPAEGRRLRLTVKDHRSPKADLAEALGGPLAFFVAPRARLRPGLCQFHHEKEIKARHRSRLLFLLGASCLIAMFVQPGPFIQPQPPLWAIWFIPLGPILIGVGLIYAILRRKLITARQIDGQFVWLENVHPDYLAEFPDLAEESPE